MAESTCLHIRDRDGGAIRVVEIPWVSARIGRAAFCEVRLTDPSLPEEACRLHRRGRSWRLAPMRGAGVLLDGEPIDGPRPLAFDVPFQVGPFRLSLKAGKFAEADWRPSTDAPMPRPTAEPPSPPLENPWEARWRDAGDRLKAARAADSHAPPPPPATEPPTPRETPRPTATRYEPPRPRPAAPGYEPRAHARPTPSARLAPDAWSRPVPTPAPPVAEPPSHAPPVAVAVPPRIEPAPVPVVEAPTPPPSPSPSRRFHFLDADALARLEALDVDEAIRPPAIPEPPKPPRTIRRRLRRRILDRRAAAPAVEIEVEIEKPAIAIAPSLAPAAEEIAEEIAEPIEEPIVVVAEVVAPAEPVPPPVEAEVEIEVREVFEPAPEPAWSCPTGPFVADTSGYGFGPVEVEGTPARSVGEDATGFDPTRTRRSAGEDAAWVLPSARDVLSGGLRRARAEANAIPRPPARPSLATPTSAIEPSGWSPPAWLAAPPALAATLALGGLLAFASWRQAIVSHQAATVFGKSIEVRLAGPGAKDRPLPAGIVPPRTSWWGAAPAHLAEWGVYLDGTKVEHGFDATAAGMFEAAAAAGPLDPMARFARARKLGDARPATGLSRDAAALAWTGRTLHRAGRNAEAIRAYRRALEIAARAEPPRDAPLAYSDDPDVPRYLLPGEAVAAAVVAELAGDDSWSYRDWSEAIPETGVSALAAARVLRREGRSDADSILKRILERAEADPGSDDADADPRERAVELAVAAEAMAMKADWKTAAGRYRVAIDQMDDPRVRRSWWFNLADVAARARDDDQRRAALDEALASTTSDEVGRRVLDLRRGSAESATNRLRSNGTKAN